MDPLTLMLLVTDLVALAEALAAPNLRECPVIDHTTKEVVGYVAPCPKGSRVGDLSRSSREVSVSFSGH
jgi:hypothetical protein